MSQFEWVPGFDAAGLSLPSRQTHSSAGYDLATGAHTVVRSGQICLVRTGVRIKLASDQYLALYARSSLAIRHRILLANGVGVIDADYYGNPENGGEILVPLWNMGPTDIELRRGERVAQGVLTTYLLTQGDTPVNAPRLGGFGSTSS